MIVRLVLKTTRNNVTTLTMNNPKKLNGWSGPMMLTLKDRSVQCLLMVNLKFRS